MKKPDHLSKDAYEKFDELYDIIRDNFREGDENLLAVLANAFLHYKMANKVLIEKGVLLSGDTMMRQNPAWNVLKEAHKMIDSGCAHFGLSAKTRGGGFEIKVTRDNPIMKLKKTYGSG